jgi:hypothetical protein
LAPESASAELAVQNCFSSPGLPSGFIGSFQSRPAVGSPSPVGPSMVVNSRVRRSGIRAMALGPKPGEPIRLCSRGSVRKTRPAPPPFGMRQISAWSESVT